MAEDPVERAARIRRSLANAVKEVRGGEPPAHAEGKTEAARRQHDRDVNALLKRTRAVIDHTRHVIEQTRSNLQRLVNKDGDVGEKE
jgi:hypothetical protein